MERHGSGMQPIHTALQRAERNKCLDVSFVPLSYFLALVISGLCKHSGQSKVSLTQQDQGSSDTGRVHSIYNVLYLLAELL